MDKILESLKKLLPADQLNEVNEALGELINEAKQELEAEFSEKLENAYSELSTELTNAENVAYQSYGEAYSIINDLRNRLDIQKEEFEENMNNEYEEAYQMILAERAKNENLSTDVYSEYDSKLNSMKQFIVEKIDQFLQYKGNEIYTQARTDILNDPRMAEHKVALDKIVEVASNYLTHEDYAFATSTRLEESHRRQEEMQAQIKIMEARNIRLSHDNTKLNEAVRYHQDLLTEGKRSERKERGLKGKTVMGRSRREVDDVEVITEHKQLPSGDYEEENGNLLESMGIDRNTINLLAGTKQVPIRK